MHEIVILAGAENDVLETYVRYETAEADLGERFSKQIEEAFQMLSEFPNAGPKFHSQIYRLLIRGFPYGIFYTIDGRRVIIQAILDLRQSPQSIRRRLGLI
jgi:plasmid stabilization system protein ParE